MTDKPYVSPPLLRPLRSEEEARRDIAKRRHRAPEGECEYCDNHRRAGADFHPSHDAMPHCESGGRSHCSCDLCF